MFNVLAVFIGPYLTVDAVWNLADIFPGTEAWAAEYDALHPHDAYNFMEHQQILLEAFNRLHDQHGYRSINLINK